MQDLWTNPRFLQSGLSQLFAADILRAIPCGVERSVRLRHLALETARVLISVAAEDLGSQPWPLIHAIGELMQCPKAMLKTIQDSFHRVTCLHFGFEDHPVAPINKCYLEYSPESDANSTDSLMFLGFKWSPSDASNCVMTRYRSITPQSWAHCADLMTHQCAPELSAVLCEMINEVACRISSVSDCMLLEVTDDNTDRLSWDLNLYDATLRLRDFDNTIAQLIRIFGIKPSEADRWLHSARMECLGHMAVGTDRTGQPFVTLYYGADDLCLVDPHSQSV